jgi:hypothetical protein
MTSQHEGVVVLSSKKPASVVEPVPVPVNTHPGPDFAPREEAA